MTREGTGSSPTYLMGQLWELNLHLLPLEHVVLRLFTDGRDLVELPRHRVRLLQGAGTAVRPRNRWGGRGRGKRGGGGGREERGGGGGRRGEPEPPQLTMISMELHLDVPQYMAIPWLITWVMARTVSANTGRQGDNSNRAYWTFSGPLIGSGDPGTYPRWVCWDRAGWQKPRRRTPAEVSAARPSDLGGHHTQVVLIRQQSSSERSHLR